METPRSNYIRMPETNTLFRAYVVATQSPLNLHMQIDWSKDVEKYYQQANNYPYHYLAEEFPGQILKGKVYNCHLKNIELMRDFASVREAGIWMTKQIHKTGGWFLITVSDIDIYRRILITMRPIHQNYLVNEEILNYRSSRTLLPIAKEYIRPQRERLLYTPDKVPEYYQIVYS